MGTEINSKKPYPWGEKMPQLGGFILLALSALSIFLLLRLFAFEPWQGADSLTDLFAVFVEIVLFLPYFAFTIFVLFFMGVRYLFEYMISTPIMIVLILLSSIAIFIPIVSSSLSNSGLYPLIIYILPICVGVDTILLVLASFSQNGGNGLFDQTKTSWAKITKVVIVVAAIIIPVFLSVN